MWVESIYSNTWLSTLYRQQVLAKLLYNLELT